MAATVEMEHLQALLEVPLPMQEEEVEAQVMLPMLELLLAQEAQVEAAMAH
jgi:hypothetical protein